MPNDQCRVASDARRCLFGVRWCVCAAASLTLAACQSASPPSPKSSGPFPVLTNTVLYQDAGAGISFEYPTGWTPNDKQPPVIFSVTSGPSVFDLTYPPLPWHIPNLIPIGRVRSGYVDDVKSKQITDAVVTDPGPVHIPDATTSRVKLAGHLDGKPAVDEAVLIVHADHVYILAIHTDDTGYTAARAALDAAVNSLRWIQ